MAGNVAKEFLSFPAYQGPGIEGYFLDFLGAKTNCAYLPSEVSWLSGKVFGYPTKGDSILFDVEEWIGVLRSVIEAKNSLTVLELGAGWGPWIVSAHVAGTKLGIKQMMLKAVEGSSGHCAFIRSHLADNLVPPAAASIVNAAVGLKDGRTLYPKLASPREIYGAEAVAAGRTSKFSHTLDALPLVSLATLMKDTDCVDVIHADVQGIEGDLFESAIEIVTRKVKRVVIGTHSRLIEGRLHELFPKHGWQPELDAACTFENRPGFGLILQTDGTQVWRNPRF